MAEQMYRKGGLSGLDPAVAQFKQQAARNKAAMTRQQLYDAARIRVRIDLPESIKAIVEQVAGGLNTSVNDLGNFLLARALLDYVVAPEIVEGEMEFRSSNSPRKGVELDSSELWEKIVSTFKTGQIS